MVSQELTLLILRLQLVWRLCAHGYHVVSFFHLVGILSISKATQECGSNASIYVLQGGTKDSVTTIRLFSKRISFCGYHFIKLSPSSAHVYGIVLLSFLLG